MGGYPSTSYLIDALRALRPLGIRERMHVADLGSGGHGHFTFPMAKLVGAQGKVYAVDVLPTALQGIESRARHENVRHVHTVWSDLERGRTNVPAGTIDRAVLANVLSQAVNRVAMLREARHLLKPRGLLLVIEWRIHTTPFGPRVERKLSRDLLLRHADEAGLEAGEEFLVGPHHNAIVFSRS